MGTVTFHSEYNAPWGSSTLPVNFDARITYSETYNQQANTTAIAITKLELKNNTEINFGSVPFYGSISIGGTTLIDIDNTTTVRTVSLPADGAYHSISLPTSATATVTHNNDGSGSFTMTLGSSLSSGSTYYFAGLYSSTPLGIKLPANKTVSLTTRSRISQVAATNANFGSASTITITRYSSSFKHTVTASCAGHSETIATKTSSTSLSWTPAVATYAPLLPKAMATTALITCKTYNGSTLIGTSTTTVVLTLPAASVKPSTTISHTDPNGYLTTYGRYVKGKSKIQVTLTNTLKYGATVKTTTITANGATYNSSPATTDVIASASNTSVSAKITDSRGQSSTTALVTISIYDYTAPKINSFSCYRSTQTGAQDNTGAYMRVNYNVTITALGNNNSKALVVRYKKKDASSWLSQSVTLSSYSQSSYVVIDAEENYTYDVQLRLTDDFSTTVKSATLPAASVRVNFGAGKNGGIGIGKVSEIEKALELASDWQLMQSGKPVLGLPRGNDLAAEDNLNSVTGVGVYNCANSSTAAQITNTPTSSAGYKLLVLYTGANRRVQVAITSAATPELFIRWQGDSWGAWYKFYSQADFGSLPFELGLGVSIPENSSLNNYTTHGSYYVANATVAASITNSPVTSMGYKLIVFALNANTYIMQVAFTYNGQILRRVKNANGWSGWYKITQEAV